MWISEDRKPAQSSGTQRVLVLALDELDPALLEQFMGEGAAPEFPAWRLSPRIIHLGRAEKQNSA